MDIHNHTNHKKTQSRGVLPRGRVIRRTLRSDPGLEYLVYFPKSAKLNPPVFTYIHGLSRNPIAQVEVFSKSCERFGVVLVAPCFTTEQHNDYQRLGRLGRGQRADLYLNQCIEEVAALTGADATQIYLCGYSAGAQFAHRYLMAHPHRVARAVVAASGWYTFPDTRIKFPYGIRSSRKLPGVIFNPEAFLRVPVTVMVGEKDTGLAGVRNNPRVNEQQGENRVQRARKWVATMLAAAEAYNIEPCISYAEVPAVNHSFVLFCEQGALVQRVFSALFGKLTPLSKLRPDSAQDFTGHDATSMVDKADQFFSALLATSTSLFGRKELSLPDYLGTGKEGATHPAQAESDDCIPQQEIRKENR